MNKIFLLPPFFLIHSDFARNLITGDLGRNSLKRGTEWLFSVVAAKSRQKCQKLGEKESKFGKYFVRNICSKSSETSKFDVDPRSTVLKIWAKNRKKKKVEKMTKSQKRGLATTVQPEPEFSRTCSFRVVLGINEDCLNAKLHQNR